MLFALTMLLIVVMACMTLSISNRVRQKLELQTLADAAAYNNAVATARGFNAMGLVNRTVVSHWVVMLGIEANLAWGSTVPAYFDGFADELNEMRFDPPCPAQADENRRQAELVAARNAFLHASQSVWNGSDPVNVPGCKNCFARLDLGRLDRAVAQQSKQVWESVRDLAEVQQALHDALQADLGEPQRLAKQAALASLGRPLTSTNLFPYEVRRGADPAGLFGVPGRPPGWREVSSALGTTREALEPLAHAAMGSRGSRFVISGKYQVGDTFFPYTPKRAKRYAMRIEQALNGRYGSAARPAPFAFQVRSNQSASFLDAGKNENNPPDGDIDEIYQYFEEADLPESETDEEATEAPTRYDPNSARRITPARSVGFKYAAAYQNGTAVIRYRSPCGGGQLRTKALTAMARNHTRMSTPAVSSHEWQQGIVGIQKVDAVGSPDGTRDYRTGRMDPLHGSPGYQDHGYERPAHWSRGRCHTNHRHWGEIDDDIHTLGNEIRGLGLSPGGFGYVFPQNGPDPTTGLDRDGASGAFGQPKLPVLITRAHHGGGLLPDPWNLTFRFGFVQNGAGARIDLHKENDPRPAAALATGIAYYHRRCDQYRPNRSGPPYRGPQNCVSWNEAPNLLNPFWHATLVPIDVDETPAGRSSIDRTPGNRLIDEAPTMLDAEGLTDAALTYRLLKARGFEGIQ